VTVRILSITRKEFIHIFRDPRTLAIMFLIPVVQLLMLGYAATTDVRHLSTAVLDQDRTPRSRALVDACRASGYFDIALYVKSEEEMARAIDSGAARAGLIIPVGYERTLARGEKAKVGFVIDGSDPNVSNTAVSAAQGVGQAHSVHILQEALVGRLDSAPADILS
jgi:ABC-2 type transport system permease protein